MRVQDSRTPSARGQVGGVLACAVSCLVLGAAGHLLAGGTLPGPGGLTLVLAGLMLVGALLFGRRRRFETIALTLGGVQFALHTVFAYLTTAAPSGMPMDHSSTAIPPSGPMASHGMTAGSMSWGMAFAHGCATLGSALCAVYGARIVRRLIGLLVRVPPAARKHAVLAVVRPWRPRPAPDHTPPVAVVLARCSPRRGPPAPAGPGWLLPLR